ncbi:MAG TPA: hypothetical protein EYG89_06115 [Bacteroidia bacterium]|nr:hypothetical protein [Bacteroidia bacterium]
MERKESFLKNMYLNSEKKDLDRFSKIIDKYSKVEKNINNRKSESLNTQGKYEKEKSLFSKVSPKT